jgi:hypothetical protein
MALEPLLGIVGLVRPLAREQEFENARSHEALGQRIDRLPDRMAKARFATFPKTRTDLTSNHRVNQPVLESAVPDARIIVINGVTQPQQSAICTG